MDHDVSSQRSGSVSTTARTFSSVRNLIKRDTVEDATNDQPKGALGLTTLHNPGNTSVTDLVFVHGLNGGSQSTWCRGRDESLFWPREWLPKDDAFRDVRIHTFGYSSGLGRESVLNIHDFATSLLVAIQDSPAIRQGEGDEAPPPLILVGHSMGGLVIKRAYIIGRQMPAYKIVGSRICAIFFLATPHQGADIANTLRRLLALVPQSLPFVNDLVPQSPVLQAINDEFPHYCSDLQLFSFFETRPMNYVVGKGLIVEKHCAVMNYRNERRTYLDANHRDAARFTSPEDPSYLTVRNAIATLIGSLRRKSSKATEDIGQERLAALGKLLVIEDSPDDDILMLNTRRLQGAGDWLLQKPVFTEWRDAYSSKLMWLRGRPGVGKSFLAGNVVNHLREHGHDVSCFFFSSVTEGKSTASAFLRTMAYQMAIIHPKMLNAIVDIFARKDSVIDKIDHNAIWRQVYLSGILKIKLDRPQYWVVDALDECKGSSDLVNFLTKAQEFWPLCVLVTSRDSFESSTTSTNLGLEVSSVFISDEDSNKDIDLFLRTNIRFLPASTAVAKQEMANRILERSRGCFLWANLMVNELRQVQTASETQMVLASNPHDMHDLYTKILIKMSVAKYGKELAKVILAWATCSFRPITTDELHDAAQMDANDTISDIEKSVTSCCGNLVFIDSRKRLQLIHLTAKEFLMSKDLKSEFAVNRNEGHTKLAIVCLRALTKERPRRLSIRSRSSLHGGREPESSESPFLHYASDYLFQHVYQAKSSNDEVLLLVAKFLASSSILNWIEHIATHSELNKVYQAGKILLNFLGRRSQHTPPLKYQKETQVLERWGNDLQHIVPRFSRRMILSPASIHHLIPPFCPPASIIYQQFRAPSRGINVQGLGATNWDDCLSTINYPKGVSPFSSAAGLGLLALGLSNGKVMIYDDLIFQETLVLNHGEPVWCLKFAKDKPFLASSSGKSIKIWNLDDGTEVYTIPVRSLIVAMAFTSSDDILVIVAKNNRLMYFSISEGCLRDEPTDWTREFAEEGLEFHLRQPTIAAVSAEQKLVAIVYRGEDILLWDIEEDRLHDVYEKETGSRENGSLKITATVRAVAFSDAPETSLLAAAFLDGDMVVYDTYSGSVVTVSRAQNAVALCSSPDGRTLASCETTAGSVTLYDFETLRVLYRISFDNNYIMAKFMNFTSDGQRLVDVRAPQCRVWQPTVLLGQDGTEKDVVSDTVTFSSGPQEVDFRSIDAVAITAILCVKPRGATSASFVFCGKEDGSVHVHDISAGGQNQSQEIFTQVANCAIMEIYFDDDTGTLTCADVIGRVTSRKISKLARSQWKAAEPHTDVKFDETITQVLCSGRHARLLVSTEDQDAIWDDGAIEHTARLNGGKERHWTPHRTNADCLLRWTEGRVELRGWESLNLVQIIDLDKAITNNPWRVFNEVISLKNTKYFATRTKSDLLALGSGISSYTEDSNIHIWEYDNFSSSSPSPVKPVCSLGPLTSSIECIVGIFGERLVYLENVSFWVCSIDITDPLEVPVRHFFIPNDWLSLVHSFVLDIGKAGEIMFVKQSELAVIRRGLETTESGIAFNPRKRGGINAMVSPGLPSRPGPSVLKGRRVPNTG